MDLPKPLLGDVTAITITTPDLEKSLTFYKKLGFSEIMRMDFPFPWIQVSDGALLIMLRKDDKPYIALTYYVRDANEIVKTLESAGISFIEQPKPADVIKRYLFQSPDGMNISLVQIPNGFTQPTGPTMLTMAQEDYVKPDKYANKVIGMWGEFAQAVEDLDKSISFWEKIGFQTLSKFSQPSPWAILSDGLAIVGLHQTRSFSKPTMTFFAADMKNKIDALKANGLEFSTYLGPGNVVLTTPENQDINLYSLGM